MDTPTPAASDETPAPSADAPRTAAAAELFGGREGKGSKAPKPNRPDEDTWDAEDSLLSWRLIAAIAGVLILVGFGAYKLFGSTKADDKKTSTVAQPTPDDNVVEITDSFSGSSTDGLGKTDTGQAWEIPSGKWGKSDGHASVIEPNTEGGGRTMALVDLTSANGTVSAKVAKMAPGWGLVFRYKGAFNYWMLTASPKYATYNLVKVADGKATPMGKASGKQDDGTVVGVQFQGPNISIVVNDKVLLTISDPSNGGTKVGIAAADSSAKDAQWSEFHAKAGKGAADLPTLPPSVPGKSTTTAKSAPTTTAPKAAGAAATSTTAKKDAKSG